DKIDSFPDCFNQEISHERCKGELAAELERVDQRVGRKAVSERGDGRIVVRRIGEASPAERAAGRGQRAARAQRAGEPRQIGVAAPASAARRWTACRSRSRTCSTWRGT